MNEDVDDSEELPPVIIKTRICLKCRKSFQSKGKRLCKICTELNKKIRAIDFNVVKDTTSFPP